MGIVIETTQLKIYGYLTELCEYAGLSTEWTDDMWKELLLDAELYNEFIYYLENHTFLDKLKVHGYSLSELYVYQMDKYNIIHELGKNPTTCNKETMVMNSFYMMSQMKKDPEKYIKKLEAGWGNDKL